MTSANVPHLTLAMTKISMIIRKPRDQPKRSGHHNENGNECDDEGNVVNNGSRVRLLLTNKEFEILRLPVLQPLIISNMPLPFSMKGDIFVRRNCNQLSYSTTIE